jgi:hypothetical protein
MPWSGGQRQVLTSFLFLQLNCLPVTLKGIEITRSRIAGQQVDVNQGFDLEADPSGDECKSCSNTGVHLGITTRPSNIHGTPAFSRSYVLIHNAVAKVGL